MITIIKEIKIADDSAIHQKEAELFTLQKLSEIKEDSKALEYKIKSRPRGAYLQLPSVNCFDDTFS